jgi:hypothetical protein
MVTNLLVSDLLDDGRTLVAALLRDGVEVEVAFWVRRIDKQSWQLYIASPQFVPEKRGNFPIKVYNHLQNIPNSSIDFGQVRLIADSEPIARAARALRDRSKQGRMAQCGEGQLGDLPIEEAYIYPSIILELTQDEVIQKVVELMHRTGPLAPSKVTMRDGSVFQGIPIGLEVSNAGGIAVAIQDATTKSKETILADSVSTIE